MLNPDLFRDGMLNPDLASPRNNLVFESSTFLSYQPTCLPRSTSKRRRPTSASRLTMPRLHSDAFRNESVFFPGFCGRVSTSRVLAAKGPEDGFFIQKGYYYSHTPHSREVGKPKTHGRSVRPHDAAFAAATRAPKPKRVPTLVHGDTCM